jgi:hypothetical protein
LTTVLQQVNRGDHPGSGSAAPAVGSPGRRRRRLFTGPAWPIEALLIAWPVWWLLGFGDYIVVLLAFPMMNRMYAWRSMGRKVRMPPGFGLWVMFLIVMLAGVLELGVTAPDTIASPTSHRIISWAVRALDYGGVTILLLYAGNLTERELPRKRLAWLLGLVGIYAVVGGLCGVIAPSVHFTSPLAYVIPQSQQLSNGQLFTMLHPGFSQVQNFLGYAEGRPMAPFDYTNMWGNALAILLPWLIVAWWCLGTRRQRQWTGAILAIALIPAVKSLDRGLWVGVGCTVVYLAVRFALRGRIALLVSLITGIVVVTVVVFASPLHSLISQRLSHGASNQSRLTLSVIATKDVLNSPILGYGDTRHAIGSAQSITIGKKASCRNCGNSTIGGNGQFWLLMISTGVLGTALYCAFFGYGIWRYRRDHTPYGMAGVLVLELSFVFMLVYATVGPVINFMMLSYALLWRNDREMRRGGTPEEEEGGENSAQAGLRPRAVTAGVQA